MCMCNDIYLRIFIFVLDIWVSSYYNHKLLDPILKKTEEAYITNIDEFTKYDYMSIQTLNHLEPQMKNLWPELHFFLLREIIYNFN